MQKLSKQANQAVRHNADPTTIIIKDIMFHTNIMPTNFLYLQSDSEVKEERKRATMYRKGQLFRVNFYSVNVFANSEPKVSFITLVCTQVR